MEFKTKYNIGDTFWIMSNNKPLELIVDRIAIDHYQESIGCYTVIDKTDITYYHNHKYSVAENDFYKTKQELLKQL